jgi:hypothetical protein
VVEARVHQLQRDDRDAEQLLHLGVRAGVGAEAGAGQHELADDEEVALALVDVPGLGDALQVEGGQAPEVGRTLGPPLGVGEPGAQGMALEDEAAVGREHHVGQAGLRLDELDLVTERQVGPPEGLPLPHGEVAVGTAGDVHPRVDRVADLEVRGGAHEVAPRRRDALGVCGGPGKGQDNGHSWLLAGCAGAARRTAER